MIRTEDDYYGTGAAPHCSHCGTTSGLDPDPENPTGLICEVCAARRALACQTCGQWAGEDFTPACACHEEAA